MRRIKDSRFSRGSRGSVVQAESAIVRVASRCAANSAGGSDFQAAAPRFRGDFAGDAGSGAKPRRLPRPPERNGAGSPRRPPRFYGVGQCSRMHPERNVLSRRERDLYVSRMRLRGPGRSAVARRCALRRDLPVVRDAFRVRRRGGWGRSRTSGEVRTAPPAVDCWGTAMVLD
jgi:hypothetical protein